MCNISRLIPLTNSSIHSHIAIQLSDTDGGLPGKRNMEEIVIVGNRTKSQMMRDIRSKEENLQKD